MNAEVEIKLKAMAKGFVNRHGDAADLFALFKTVFEMRIDVQKVIVEVEKPVEVKVEVPVVQERIVEKLVYEKLPVNHVIMVDGVKTGDLWEARREIEKRVVLDALRKSNWNRRQAANALAVSYRWMFGMIKQFKLTPGYVEPANENIPQPVTVSSVTASCDREHIEDEELLKSAPTSWINCWRRKHGLPEWSWSANRNAVSMGELTERRRAESKWKPYISECLKLAIGESCRITPPKDMYVIQWVNRFRSVLRASTITSSWKWSIHLKQGIEGYVLIVTKGPLWRSASQMGEPDGTSSFSAGISTVH